MRLMTTMLLLAYGLSCNKPPKPDTSQKPLEAILGVVDSPTPNSTMREAATVGGWALAEGGVQRVAIFVDRQFVTFASLGGERPDIEKAFPDFQGAGRSGWGAIVDFSQMVDGSHQLLVQIRSKSGRQRDLPPIPFKVVH